VRHVVRAVANVPPNPADSTKLCLSSMVEFDVQLKLETLITDAYVESVFGNARGVAAIRAQLLSDLEGVWASHVAPLVDAERATAVADAVGVGALHDAILLSYQMVRNGRDDASVASMLRRHFATVAHTASRIASDPWYAEATAVGVLRKLVDASNTDASNASNADAAVVEWVRAHAQPTLGALERARHRLLAVHASDASTWAKRAEGTNPWIGLEVDDTGVATTCQQLVAPAVCGAFASPSRRAYVRACATRSDDGRALRAARLLHAVATLVEREWMPLGRIGHRYALELIDGQVASLRMYCASLETGILEFARASGCVVDALALSAYVVDAFTPPPQTRDDDAVVPIVVDALGAPHAVMHATALTVHDFYHAPRTRRRHLRPRSAFVPTHALLQYFAVFAVARSLHDAVTNAMECHVTGSLAFENASLFALFKHFVHSAAVATVPANHAYDASTLRKHEDATLHAVFSNTVRQLCNEAGFAQSAAAAHGKGVGRFTVRYEPTRAKGQRVLHVANSVLDENTLALLEFTIRILSHMEESWPLPDGVTWKLGVALRLPRKSR
jgi:hypothetical protein